jgi:hypothetical protein
VQHRLVQNVAAQVAIGAGAFDDYWICFCLVLGELEEECSLYFLIIMIVDF